MVVERDRFVGAYLASTAKAWGADVLGPFADAVGALDELCRGRQVSAASLGADLDIERLAAELDLRDVPYIITSGQSDTCLPRRLRAAPILRQPYAAHDVLRELQVLLGRKASASIVEAYDEARASAPSYRVRSGQGGVRAGLQAATTEYVRVYGRPPGPGVIETIVAAV